MIYLVHNLVVPHVTRGPEGTLGPDLGTLDPDLGTLDENLGTLDENLGAPGVRGSCNSFYDPWVMVDIPHDPVARAQAAKLVSELERAADLIVEELEAPTVRDSSLARRRAELYEARAHIRRLQERFDLGTRTPS
ncbi:hypothetical protein ACWDTD_03965 [Gordonia sp. NPDC003425]